ncbi:hypothetical protein RB195_011375 [Necator americanus]|uniref:DUF7083 domain-containing protein n=1 Tax=Necator americanus TaxID=51031 RepID=A0ABR1D294_NECAM
MSGFCGLINFFARHTRTQQLAIRVRNKEDPEEARRKSRRKKTKKPKDIRRNKNEFFRKPEGAERNRRQAFGVAAREAFFSNEVNKDQYDQHKEPSPTFVYWFKRYGLVIRDSTLSDSRKRDLIVMKLDEDAYRRYADDILPKKPHEFGVETTVTNLKELFASKKTLIRRQYDCLRIKCSPLNASYVSL